MSRYPSSAWRNFQPATIAPLRAAPNRACRVLGLDPGSQRTGFGIVDCDATGVRHVASGCINVAGEDFLLRLRRIFDAVVQLIDEHQPGEVAIERVFVHKNPDSALKLGQARGAALCAAVGGGASMHEYAPRAIKLAVTGYGAAEKPQVAQMVTTLLGLPKRPAADAADALAVAMCHVQSRQLTVLLAAGGAAGARR